MTIIRALMVFCVVLSLLVGCKADGDNGNGDEPPADNPIPVLSSISPTSKVAHLPAFTLTATGTDFVDGATIVFKGVEKETTFVSSTELTCTISPEDTALIAGDSEFSAPRANALVMVRNPLPGGGDSNSLDFTIQANHTFATGQALTSDFQQAYYFGIAVEPSGGVNAVFTNSQDYEPHKLFMRRSSDGGATWGAVLDVTENPANMPAWPELAINEAGDFYCLYSRETNGYFYFQRSSDGGQTWTAPVRVADYYISPNPIGSNGEMRLDSQGTINVLLIMDEMEGRVGNIFFTRSSDGGATWSPKLFLTEQEPGIRPALAVDSQDNLYVAWFKQRAYHRTSPWFVHLRRSSNGGAQWTAGIDVNEGNGGFPGGFPNIAVSPLNDHVYLVWDSRSNYYSRDYQVFFSRSTDRGATWSTPLNISASPDINYYPEIAVDAAGNINVIWSRNGALWFRRSTNDGSTWSQIVQISELGRNTFRSRIGVDAAGNVKLLWRSHWFPGYQIYFSSSQ